MMQDGKLPALRSLEITPFQDKDGQLFFQLRDMLQISPRPIVISSAGYLILAHLDGQHTIADVQQVYQREANHEMPAEEIERVVDALDRLTLLETPRFEAACAAMRNEYLRAPYRDGRERWPTAEVVRGEIEGLLAGARPQPVGEVRGLVAPHLDYARGAPCYAAAYSTLMQSPPADRYVILGTNHFGQSTSVVATKKDFQTPLGLVPTDRAFITRLEERLGSTICEHECDHRTEHSVELQVHMLQVCLERRPFEIVPVICPDVCGASGTAPADNRGPDLVEFADALAGVATEDKRRTVIIAGADMSHIGRSFGDTEQTTAGVLAEVEQRDRRVLGLFAENGEVRLVEELRATRNPTKICSIGCIYALRRALRGRPWQTLCYHQAVDAATDTNVTCAAAAIC